jgi:asparagine synthase (glutamine-hydrolysing)
VALGHRRLAIIDLRDQALQPMTDSVGQLTIVFNGEIYNYRELRRDLETRGHRFCTESDTEVILNLFSEYGAAMCDKLRGMFAFAIRDERSGSLFLARDAHGIKPLYYADDGQTFRFASQVKALLASRSVARDPDSAGYVGYYLWGSVPEPFTLFRSIRALPPGSWFEIRPDGKRKAQTFCSISQILREAEDRLDRRLEAGELHSRLLESVRYHLVSDVPVAVFLSAGVDSQCIATLAREAGHRELRSVTMGFEEYHGTPRDEVPLAEECARRNSTIHVTRMMAGNEFKTELDRFMTNMDQPTIDGMNTYMVSKAAAEQGLKVCLSGLGGDELFGGYDTFADVPRLVRAVRTLAPVPAFGRALRWVSAGLIGRFTSPKYAGLFELGRTYEGAYLLHRGLFMPWELPRLLPPEMIREGWGQLSPMARSSSDLSVSDARIEVASLEMNRYMRNQLLRDADWAGMAHSIEIRVPFVDVALLKALAPFLHGRDPFRKPFVAKSCNLVLPERPKSGFSIPVREWFAGEHGIGSGQSRGLRGWATFALSRIYGSGQPLAAI